MGKMTLKKTAKQFLISFFVLFFILTFLLFTIINKQEKIDYTKLRIDSSILINQLLKDEKTDEYTYFLTNLDQNIIASNSEKHSLNSFINVYKYNNEIEIVDGELYYNTPFISEDSIIGHLVIIYPLKDYIINNNKVILTSLLVIIFSSYLYFLYCYYQYLKKDIINPLNKLLVLTDNLLIHNYDLNLDYDLDNEIGSLCHNLEMLRDELQNQEKTKQKYHENERMLLACISHDLRTPLATISGYVEGISLGVVKNEKEINDYTRVILNKIKVLNKLIDDILEHSKIQMDELSINLKEEYTNEIFTKIINDLAVDVKENNRILIVNDIPNVIVLMDKKRIMQVMQNLISNAIKYTDVNGIIEIGFTLYENKFVVAVKDNGNGISVNDLPFIFNRFYRGDKARTLNTSGSGLGLNIAKHIIEKHDGKISCESIINQETVFTFYLKF